MKTLSKNYGTAKGARKTHQSTTICITKNYNNCNPATRRN